MNNVGEGSTLPFIFEFFVNTEIEVKLSGLFMRLNI